MRTSILTSLAILLALTAACDAKENPVNAHNLPKGFDALARATPDAESEHDAGTVVMDVMAIEAVASNVQPSLYELEGLASDDDRDHYGEGERAMQDENYDEAVLAFRRSLFLQPSAQVFKALANAYKGAGEIERGVACMEEAVALNRYFFDERLELARHHMGEGNFTKARALAEGVAINRIDDVEANMLIGKIYLKSNMWNEAVTAYSRITSVAPNNKYIRNNLGYAALQVGQNELALQHLEKTLDLEPTAYMLNNLGLAYERDDRSEEAMAAFMRAGELRANYVKAQVNVARVKGTMNEEQVSVAMDILGEFQVQTETSTVAKVDAATEDDLIVD